MKGISVTTVSCSETIWRDNERWWNVKRRKRGRKLWSWSKHGYHTGWKVEENFNGTEGGEMVWYEKQITCDSEYTSVGEFTRLPITSLCMPHIQDGMWRGGRGGGSYCHERSMGIIQDGRLKRTLMSYWRRWDGSVWKTDDVIWNTQLWMSAHVWL